jgi:thioredoxin
MNVPDGVITISSIDAFNKLVNGFRENLIIVDFFADWCGPCQSFLPIYQKVQQLYYPKGVIFTRINSDHFPEVSAQFGIKGVPSLILIRNNKGLKKHVGALGGKELMEMINQYL